MSPRILIIEDEPAIADTLRYALRTEGFAPEWHATGRAGLAALGGPGEPVALVLLDVGLPDTNGFDLCRTIRARSPVPVLFLTARGGEIDRVLGLELGGDDYVTKPFSPREVTARVKAILRRGTQPATCNVIRYKPEGSDFAMDEERHEAHFCGQPLELTRYEYRLLLALLARPGRVFSRDELMTAAWDDPGSSLDRTVDAHIKTLRATLRAVAPDANPIQTHRGIGYALKPGRSGRPA